MKKEFTFLEKHYRTQADIAEEFGVSVRTYQRWRDNGTNLPEKTKKFIKLKVKELEFKTA